MSRKGLGPPPAGVFPRPSAPSGPSAPPDKYIALALLSPYGVRLRRRVEERWSEWEGLCSRLKLKGVPEEVYAEALWRYGFLKAGAGSSACGAGGSSAGGADARLVAYGGPRADREALYVLDNWLNGLVRELT